MKNEWNVGVESFGKFLVCFYISLAEKDIYFPT